MGSAARTPRICSITALARLLCEQSLLQTNIFYLEAHTLRWLCSLLSSDSRGDKVTAWGYPSRNPHSHLCKEHRAPWISELLECVCAHVHARPCVCARVHARPCVCVCVHAHVCLCVSAHPCVVCVCVRGHVYTPMCVCVCVCTPTCVCVCPLHSRRLGAEGSRVKGGEVTEIHRGRKKGKGTLAGAPRWFAKYEHHPCR